MILSFASIQSLCTWEHYKLWNVVRFCNKSVELAHHWARNLVPTLLLIAPSPNPWISISLLCIFYTLKKLSLHRRHSKPLKSYSTSCIAPGHEITASQWTMSGLIAELTGQLFFLPVMLTGHMR